jgi:uncharacterized protein
MKQEPVMLINPATFHFLVKPTGAICNLGCKYCFVLSEEKLYPNSALQMIDEVLKGG